MMKKIVVIIVAALVIAVAALVYINTGAVTSVTVEETEPVYVIRFTDPDGNPVSGVMANVCDETTCQVIFSDEKGQAWLMKMPFPYELHVMMAPGAAVDADAVWHLPEAGGKNNTPGSYRIFSV